MDLCAWMKCFSIIGMILWRASPDSSVGKESAWNAGKPGLISGSGRSPGEGIGYPLQYSWAFLVAQLVKNLPATWETWVPSLGWEDPLEKGKAIHSSILAREFHGPYSPWYWKESDMTDQLSLLILCFKNQSSCWVHSKLPVHSTSGLPWGISTLLGSNSLALRKFNLKQIIVLFRSLLVLLGGIPSPSSDLGHNYEFSSFTQFQSE